jgi:exoribonuclease R
MLEKNSQESFIENIKVKYPQIEDRTDQDFWHIFTIDPQGSRDFDDGFSIVNRTDDIIQLSIYISNVTIWMEVLQLWEFFSDRISTIYLPDKKRPMLPPILSDCICSLQENVTRIAFVMDLFIQNGEIIDIKYTNSFIKVVKNYCYEETSLLKDRKYNMLFDITFSLSKKYKYIDSIVDSHEIVSYLMILMNYNCAKELLNEKTGILRSTIMKKEFQVPDYIPENDAKFIKIFNSASGQYIDASTLQDDELSKVRHEMLNIEAYIHITSPIRRIVDLLNMIRIQQIKNTISLSESADKFYKKWQQNVEYINNTTKSIRKVQDDSTLLDLCSNKPETMEKEYNGYLHDKIYKDEDLFQYTVFIPELKLSSRVVSRENFMNFEYKKIKLYLFNNEEKFKKKIRLGLVE